MIQPLTNMLTWPVYDSEYNGTVTSSGLYGSSLSYTFYGDYSDYYSVVLCC